MNADNKTLIKAFFIEYSLDSFALAKPMNQLSIHGTSNFERFAESERDQRHHLATRPTPNVL
jgi:hypothetical protein